MANLAVFIFVLISMIVVAFGGPNPVDTAVPNQASVTIDKTILPGENGSP
uniref:Salivary secreted peptide n=1 Tax=Anopheles dirus TaxID=7168 RepID=A0A182NXM2_9DIPT